MTEIKWRFEKPSEVSPINDEQVLCWMDSEDTSHKLYISELRKKWEPYGYYAWSPMPAKPERPKPKLREWTVFVSPENVIRSGVGSDEGVRVREIKETDPTPEAIEEVVAGLTEILETFPAGLPLTNKLEELRNKLQPQTKP